MEHKSLLSGNTAFGLQRSTPAHAHTHNTHTNVVFLDSVWIIKGRELILRMIMKDISLSNCQSLIITPGLLVSFPWFKKKNKKLKNYFLVTDALFSILQHQKLTSLLL